ncbi:MAG: transposase [Gemmataceae bacterium]|nr:transposase [Gemmataceae bacterium]
MRGEDERGHGGGGRRRPRLGHVQAARPPILRDLVTRSSLPLRAVETRFAVDSSGFSSSKFERWFDAKYGVERRRSTWVKTHICVGVDTHVVAAETGDAHDSKTFPGLVGTAADNFPLCEVVADKAYLSNDNLELVDDLGGVPYIPFKVNSTPGAPGSVWERMYHTFGLRRDEFLKHYHQRSNVESAFSMVKRKFGDSVRSKTPTAMANEVLARLVCHNVVCCIHEAHELGIAVRFGPRPEPEPEPRILRFPGA